MMKANLRSPNFENNTSRNVLFCSSSDLQDSSSDCSRSVSSIFSPLWLPFVQILWQFATAAIIVAHIAVGLDNSLSLFAKRWQAIPPTAGAARTSELSVPPQSSFVSSTGRFGQAKATRTLGTISRIQDSAISIQDQHSDLFLTSYCLLPTAHCFDFCPRICAHCGQKSGARPVCPNV